MTFELSKELYNELNGTVKIRAKILTKKYAYDGILRHLKQDDFEQEFWQKIIEKFKLYDPSRSSFKTFIDRIITSCVKELERFYSRQMRHNKNEVSYENNKPDDTALDLAGYMDRASTMQTCLDKLINHVTPRQKEFLFALYQNDGCIYRAAQYMEIKSPTAYKMRNRVFQTAQSLNISPF